MTIKTKNCVIEKTETSQTTVRPGKYVQLAVEDNGPGIPGDDLEHIFEPFYTKKKLGRSGTGLGLAVVWNTMQEHQGFVDVKQPGRGSRFELYFPATELPVANPVVAMEDTQLLGNGEHILVIDDEHALRVLAEKLLTSLGYRVSAVSSGEEALDFVRQTKVDLLLLDMLMEPGMNGYQTYRAIKSIYPAQRAVIVSGFSESNDVKKAQGLGAGPYLKKPYTLEELGLAVRNELKRPLLKAI